jgi:ankyrin repeat protein
VGTDLPPDYKCSSNQPEKPPAKVDFAKTLALVHASAAGKVDQVQNIVNSGFGPNVFGEYCETPLTAAARHGREAVVRFLLDHGADPAATNDKNQNAVDIARAANHHLIAEIIAAKLENRELPAPSPALEQQAQNTAPDPAVEAFIRAAGSGHLGRVKRALRQGVNINAVGESGDTALMAASASSCHDMIRYLLARGADPRRTNYKGITAFEVAIAHNRLDTAELLGPPPPGWRTRHNAVGTATDAASTAT